jgi:putative transposase
MARRPRVWSEGEIYHLYSRGSNRERIFLDQADYFEFSRIFATAISKHGIDCFAWAFMPNHWHAIVRCPPGGLSHVVKVLNQRYSLRFNRRRGRTAHVFKNRFGAVAQKSEDQFLWTLRYVLRNPVAAGLSPTVEAARWTSYRPTAMLVPAPPFLRVSEVLAHFAASVPAALIAFSDFVEEPNLVETLAQKLDT